MSSVGIRALKQNASEVVARAAAGEQITITDRGRPVARMSALEASAVERLVGAGLARPPLKGLVDLPAPVAVAEVSSMLAQMRDEERY
jgi:prevent-host-death family protein